MAREINKPRALDNFTESYVAMMKYRHSSRVFNAICPRCGSNNTHTDYDFGNHKCHNCSERWDGTPRSLADKLMT